MNRRRFLELLAFAAATRPWKAAAAESPPSHASAAVKDGGLEEVFLAGVTRGSSQQVIEQAVRAAAEAATDFSWLSKGDSVFIKPALNSGNEYPATTSPIAIKAIAELLKQRGAGRVVVGDMSGIEHVKLSRDGLSGSSRELMERCGMARAAQQGGAELHFFEEAGWDAFYEDEPSSGPNWKRPLMMPSILKEMDHIVLLARCGRHALAGDTLGLKAGVGYWRTDTRLEYHKDATTFQEKTAEGNTVSTLRNKQRLVLTAADKILTTFGPDIGHVTEPKTGLVIASRSVVAHDMVSLAWLLVGRQETEPSEFAWFRDPYTSSFIVTMANRWVVSMLGGVFDAFSAEPLTRNDLTTIWDDRTLNRAYQVFGGRPRVHVKPANNLLPAELKQRLTAMVTPPA